MAQSRRYRLLCPIARALDHIGDRWTLLILRDLHAGPARFSDLQKGLEGIASNLLTDRLQQLIGDKIVMKRSGDYGVALYALTGLGERTRDLLFELAMFGGQFAPDPELQRPGNLRTIAVTLSAACQRVVTPDLNFEAELRIDGELFALAVGGGSVEVRYAAAESPDVTMTTSYEPMMAATDGEMPMDDLLKNHVQIAVRTPGKDRELMTLLGAAMTLIGGET